MVEFVKVCSSSLLAVLYRPVLHANDTSTGIAVLENRFLSLVLPLI